MTVGADDFDVFVLTYNRSALLPATLDSLLAQTLGTPRITVLDNGSTDATAQVVLLYATRGVRYLPAPQNLGWKGNLSRAQQLAERPWVMAFHDDDLMHPGYLRAVAGVIERYADVALIASGMTFDAAPSADNWPRPSGRQPVVCRQPSDLARLLYRGFPLPFCSAVYQSAVFRSLRVGDQYGKIADRPFLLDAAERGTAIVLPDPFVRYRVHAGQDSGTPDSGPFVPELAALHARYRDLLGTSVSTRNGRTFLSRFFGCLNDEYRRLAARDRAFYRNRDAYVRRVCQSANVGRLSLELSKLCWLMSFPRQLIRLAAKSSSSPASRGLVAIDSVQSDR